jgi:hypothetical protein
MIAATQSADAQTIYVSPRGQDAWSGRRATPGGGDGPVASLRGARDAVRRLKATGTTGPIHVVFASGIYRMGTPVEFTPEDSGSPESPIVYEAAPKATVVLSGGRPITGLQAGTDGVWRTTLPEVAVGRWKFDQLWVNGLRAVRARTPKQFYHYMRGKVPYGHDPMTDREAALPGQAFVADPADIAALAPLSKEALRNVVVVVYHSWEISRHRIAGIDPRKGIIYLTGPAPWNFMEWAPSQRYHIENLPSALTEPGEWTLEGDGTLAYMPRAGEDLKSAEIVAPVSEQFVLISGTVAAPVRNLTFRNLRFEHGQYVLPQEGHGDTQAAVSFPAVIQADFAHDLRIESCEVAHAGVYGVWFRRGCTGCTLEHSYLHDLGAGGVRIGETEIRPEGPDTTSHCTVSNCILRQCGRIDYGAIGVWIGQSGDNQIVHNDIGNQFYTGVSTGWTWGYAPGLAKRNIVEYNRIHDIGQGVLSDMGGVYTLGLSEGSSVSHNLIHEVYSYDHYGAGGWGLYNDEGSTGITLEDNLVYHVKTGAYHQHYGMNNLVRNNILALSMNGQLQRSRVEDHLSFTLERNIIYYDRDPLLNGSWNDANVKLDHNLYWNASGNPVLFNGKTLEQWQATGKDEGSIVANPEFVNPSAGDFRLKPGSPAAKIGFVPFDYTQAGVTGDASWKALAARETNIPVHFAPDPPPASPVSLDLDFEHVPVGAACPDAQNHVEGRGDSIAVTEETAASGRRSLKITDAPGLQFPYDPHLVFTPNYRSGHVTFSFDVRAEEGTEINLEGRDWRSNPYRVGFSVWLKNGAVLVNDHEVGRIPLGQWTHFELAFGMGSRSTHTWDMTVSAPGIPTIRWDRLPIMDPGFQEMTWLGFISNATTRTVYYLDNIRLHSTE